ncbi:MAG TPA: hypothetical protein PK177_01735 [Burkholderiaceae bacterium]|nr:hypothetical protein [Burkholderiaceae bacterium]
MLPGTLVPQVAGRNRPVGPGNIAGQCLSARRQSEVRSFATPGTGRDPARSLDFDAVFRAVHGLRISLDGTQIYVANVKADAVSVIDTATRKDGGLGRSGTENRVSRDGFGCKAFLIEAP